MGSETQSWYANIHINRVSTVIFSSTCNILGYVQWYWDNPGACVASPLLQVCVRTKFIPPPPQFCHHAFVLDLVSIGRFHIFLHFEVMYLKMFILWRFSHGFHTLMIHNVSIVFSQNRRIVYMLSSACTSFMLINTYSSSNKFWLSDPTTLSHSQNPLKSTIIKTITLR